MRCLLCFSAALALALPVAADPTYDLTIRAGSTLAPLSISGSVADPGRPSLPIADTPALAGYTLSGPGGPIDYRRTSTSPSPIKFTGTFTQRNDLRFRNGDGEVSCLPGVRPVPELEGVGSAAFRVKFELPEGFRGLAPDPTVRQDGGPVFQIARLQEPKVTRVGSMEVEYDWPADFTPEPRYVTWFEQCLEQDLKMLGSLPVNRIRVGAIRRGSLKEVGGALCGNLLLYSRSALGGSFDPSALQKLSLRTDLSDGVKKLVIAQQLAGFWFGQLYRGSQGWMSEGMSQYVALVNLMGDSSVDHDDVMKFLEAGGKSVRGPIPATGLEGANYIRAHFQAPCALWELGGHVGQESFLKELNFVFASKPDPQFEDFEHHFLAHRARHTALWRTVWKMSEKETE